MTGRNNERHCVGTLPRRTSCIVCGHTLPPEPVITLDGMPESAQNIPTQDQLAQDAGITLELYQCAHCGLVQFDCEPVGYFRDVIRSGGYSTTMAELRTRQYRHLIDTYHLEGKKFLEVGCGQGEFLRMLSAFPVHSYGVEHRTSLAEKARQEGQTVSDGFTETADTVLGVNGPYDVFLSFNFLEHQPEPGVMLDCIRNNLSDGGLGLITVPSLEYILAHDGYYELIRDHIAYYTFGTLRYLLKMHGFCVLEEEMVNRDTISVIVRKGMSAPRTPYEDVPEEQPILPDIPVLTAKAEVHAVTMDRDDISGKASVTPGLDFSGLAASCARIRSQLLTITEGFGRGGKVLAIWGASHQGFTLAATTCLKERAAYIIDSAPFKQGKFAPASHLPIVSPKHYEEEPAEAILIVAPGYTEEIYQSIRTRFGAKPRIWTLRGEKVEELS